MNSARVVGGEAAAPLHSTEPEPQSPVAHVSRPEESEEQAVRAQKRPDHPVGAENELDVPAGRAKPVGSSKGLPELERIPGQIVSPQLFTKVNVALFTPRSEKETKMRSTARAKMGEGERSNGDIEE